MKTLNLLVCLFAILTLGIAADSSRAQVKGPPPARVVAEPARPQKIAPTALLLGTVMPPRKSVVGSAVDGRVEQVPVREGDPVSGPTTEGQERVPGQTLAQILTETIKIELRAAEAELDLRKHELGEIELRREEIVQADAKLKSADALRTFAKAKLERAEALFQQNRAGTKEQFDEAISVAEAAEQNFRSAVSSHKLAEEGHPEKIEQAKARFSVQQEEVNRLNDRIRKFTLHAPFDGYVSALHTEIGAWIKQGDPVAEVIELDYVDVVVGVPENYIANVRKGAPSAVTLDSLPGRQFAGSVSYVVPQADLRSRTFPVKVRVKNETDADGVPTLKAGMLAKAQLRVGAEDEGIAVRRDALVLADEHKFVFVATIDPKTSLASVRRESVRLGPSDGTRVIIHGNVKPNELIVVVGNERLQPGQAVHVTIEDPKSVAELKKS